MLWLAFGLMLSLLATTGPADPARSLQAATAAATPAAGRADVEVFVREGCPHCAKAEAFLAGLARERPDLRIVIRDIGREPDAMDRLREISATQSGTVRVPAFRIRDRLIVGYSDDATTGRMIRNALAPVPPGIAGATDEAGSCEAEESLSCEGGTSATSGDIERYEIEFLGRKLSVEQVGLPAFTLAMGLLDGFNPCSMWVLLLMISLLAPMNDRPRMLAIAGTFIAVEGVAYFVFMAAWLNLFLFIGLSRISELAIAAIALLAGTVNLKDFVAFGRGFSLSIPDSAKPGIYARMRRILHAENLLGALVGVFVLALLVQIVEFMCTSGFPALYTRILTLHHLEGAGYYGYLLLYNLAYMLDDVIVLSIGVITLSQHRLQEREGRWLKLISGSVMVALGFYLILRPRL